MGHIQSDRFTVLDLSVQKELQVLVRSRSLSAETSRRCRLILMLSNGESYTSVCRILDCDPSYVSRWKKRFLTHGLSGLYSQYRGRKVQARTQRLEVQILDWTRQKPTDGSGHWTTRKLGAQLGINHMMVARVWARAGLKPHRIERFSISNDPDSDPTCRRDYVILESE